MTTLQEFTALCAQRSSCRAYAETPVPRELIDACLEAARLAPSACNKQPWRFVIADNPATTRRLCDEALLPGLPMPWLHHAPVIVALCAKTSLLTHTIAPVLSGVDYWLVDLGIAGEHFVLAAHSVGLGTCWIGWFKEKAVRNILGIPRGVRVASLLSLGYPVAGDSRSPEKLPLSQIRAYDTWSL